MDEEDRWAVPIDAALRYIEKGWSVVPVHSPVEDGCSCGDGDCPSSGKHPRVRWDAYRHRRASAAEVRAWWSQWPDANVGIVTGTISGLAVVDIDPRHGGDGVLAQLEQHNTPLPRTPAVFSGGRGRHLYFRHPARHTPSGCLTTGIDLKADGGLVVAPPSRHHSGGTYRWAGADEIDLLPLADLPHWLLDLAEGLEPWTALTPGQRRPGDADRSDDDRLDFAELWATHGVFVRPGDRMYRCPFHPDEHPSLHVDSDGCRWYCFGCQRGGGLGRLRRLTDSVSQPTVRTSVRTDIEQEKVTLPKGPDVEVVGESLHQDALLELTGGRRRRDGVDMDAIATLVPEPDNPEDPEAVAVTIGGEPVGHLRREDARRLRPLIDRVSAESGSATCEAVIRGGWDRGRGDVGMFGVKLRIG